VCEKEKEKGGKGKREGAPRRDKTVTQYILLEWRGGETVRGPHPLFQPRGEESLTQGRGKRPSRTSPILSARF